VILIAQGFRGRAEDRRFIAMTDEQREAFAVLAEV